MILITASALVTAKQYIGDPIDCIVEEIPQGVMDTYCWIHSTFSVTPTNASSQAHPGVGVGHEALDEFRYHKYYQWVCFTLFFQALCFYIPRYRQSVGTLRSEIQLFSRYLWKMWEAGKLNMLVQGKNLFYFLFKDTPLYI